MSSVQRIAGVTGTFPYTLDAVPFSAPQMTIYRDALRTDVAVPAAGLVATANPAVFTATYPATLAAGSYFLQFETVFTSGQPALVDADDTLLLLAPGGSVSGDLMSLDELKTQLGIELTDHGDDDELNLMVAAATPVIENMTGPILPRTVTQVIDTCARMVVLDEAPVLSVDGVLRRGITLTGWTLRPEAGLVVGADLSGATVTYTVGRATVPPNVKKAALRWAAYWWRREHGGSDTYMPGGEDLNNPGPLGVTALDRQLRALLGPDLRSPRVQ